MTARITSYQRDGLTFDVRDEGPLEGEVVVLLHGFPQMHTSWDRVAPLLHERGLRTLAPDQRGYSPGARPPGRQPYRTSELVRDVLALVERSGADGVHLVGHDWGAAVAWAAAITRPERLRTLTAVSVPHPGAFLAAMPRGQALHSWYMALFNLPWLPERLLGDPRTSRWFLRRGGMSEAMLADYRRDFIEGGALRGGLGWYRALPLANRKLFGQPVRVPTTYVWSDRDAFLGRAGAQLCERYVEAPYRFEVLQGVSHWIPEEAPERLARLVHDRVASTA